MLILSLTSCSSFPVLNPNKPDYGEIQIYSDPVNAAIYLDGNYTGFNTPHKLTNISSGSHMITLKLSGYLDSSKMVQVYPNQVNTLQVSLTPIILPPSPGTGSLTQIKVTPDSMEVIAGDFQQITSIIASYSDGLEKELAFNQCSISSLNQGIATVSSDGQINGISTGKTDIWISYTENNITKPGRVVDRLKFF